MNISLQDILAIMATVSAPIVTFMGLMWHHSNNKFEKLFEKLDEKFEKLDEKFESLRGDIHGVEKRLGEKIDAVRDRVSRIEGQLAPTSIVAFNPPMHKESTRAIHSS